MSQLSRASVLRGRGARTRSGVSDVPLLDSVRRRRHATAALSRPPLAVMVLCFVRCCLVSTSSEDELRERLELHSVHGSGIVDDEAILDSIQPLNMLNDCDLLTEIAPLQQKHSKVRVKLQAAHSSPSRQCIMS